MSRIRTNLITNRMANGAPTVSNGLVISGVTTSTTFSGSGALLTNLPAQATISNNSDNRVITGGSGVNLNGEVDLVWDGSRMGVLNQAPQNQYFNTLVVGNNSAGDKGITIRTNNTSKGVLAFSDTDSADANRYDGYIAYQHSDQSMRFNTGGANERLRIRSDGKISAGTSLNTSNTYEFSLTGADATGGFYAHGRNHYLSNRSNAYASLTLKKSNSDSDATDYFQLRDSSNNLKASISGAGNWKPIAGGGIDFSATSDAGGMASELLDDYEEGSFTPNLIQGYSSITYNANNGFYTKIGNHVSYSIYISVLSASGQNAEIRIGLPFTTKNTQRLEEGAYIVYDSNTLSTSNDEKSNCYIMSGRNYTYLRLFKNTNAAAIYGNDTTLGTGGNNTYLLIKGFLTTA